MKKTIITLLALAGVASANYSGTFAWEAGNTPEFTFSNAPDIYLIIDEVKVDGTVSTTPKANSVYSNALTPATNIGTGGSWSVGFSVLNYTEETLTLESITLDAFAYNNGGSAQSADFLTREITFALTGAVDASVVHSFTNVDAEVDEYNWDSNPTITFSAPLEIAAGDAAAFTLTVSKSDSVGCFIGLSGATLVTPAPTPAVPEPTTATLSLLALAGLAARRRRK